MMIVYLLWILEKSYLFGLCYLILIGLIDVICRKDLSKAEGHALVDRTTANLVGCPWFVVVRMNE